MKRRFTEEQIIGILREQEAGAKVKELTRRHGVSEQSFYRWKAKYGGLEVSEARRLKTLEAENGKLKKLLAEAHLDNAALKDVLSRNGEAGRQADGGFASGLGASIVAAPGLPAGRSQLLDLAVCAAHAAAAGPA